jgi:hypothetical protein
LFFLFDDAYVALKFGSIAGWLTTWAMGLPTGPQTTATFCSTDPPTDLPTTADYAAIGFPLIGLISGAYRRFGNQIASDKWSDLCNCAAPVGGGCGTPPSFTGDTVTFAGPAQVTAWQIPASATGATIVVHPHARTSGTNWKIFLFGAAAINSSSGGPQVTAIDSYPADLTASISFAAGAYAWLQFWAAADPGGTWDGLFDWVLTFTGCSGAAPIPYTSPPNPTQPTDFPVSPTLACSTSQDVCTALQTLSLKLDWMRAQVDLIQRQDVPFAYILGPTNAGLTGDGDVSVQGILGLSVLLTTVPSTWGETADVPRRLIPKAGALQFMTTEGYTDEVQLHYDHELILGVPAVATSVHYTLRPGIVASLTTLMREP